VHDLVAGVTGFDQQRGDQITVESLPFASTLEPETGLTGSGSAAPAKPKTWKDLLKDTNMLIAAGLGAGVVLLLAVGGLFLFRGKKKAPVTVATTPALNKGADPVAAVEEAKAKMAIESANAAEQLEAALAERVAEQQKADMAAIAALKLPTVTTKKSELLAKEIREGTKKDPSVPAHVITNWLHEG